MSGVADGYREVRARIWELGGELDERDAERPVPCTPEWTVRDLFAHLSGVVADALAGNMEGAATDPWTARQVEARAAWTLAQILDEWRTNTPAFDAVLDQVGEAMDPRLCGDIWTHEQDLRHALDRPGGRDGVAARFVVDLTSRSGYSESIEWIDEDGAARIVGKGPVAIRLRLPRFDFARARLGRRSAAQIAAFPWEGDPAPWLDRFCVFGPARAAIDEG